VSGGSPISRGPKSLTRFAAIMLVVGLAFVSYWRWSPDSALSTDDQPVAISTPSEVETAASYSASPDSGEDSVVVATPSALELKDALKQALDPQQDGWHSEAISDECLQQLKVATAILSGAEPTAEDRCRSVADIGFACEPLRPADLKQVWSDDSTRVWRRSAAASSAEVSHRGRQGLVDALRALAGPLADAHEVHVETKIVEIDADATPMQTTAHLHLSGRTPDGSVQLNLVWNCQWNQGNLPQLAKIEVRSYEEVTTDAPGGTWFADCTEAVLGENASFRGQLRYGLNHWLRRIESVHLTTVFSYCGLAVGDVNGDGLDDIYVCQPGGLPNRLFVQNQSGTAGDQSQSAGVDILDNTRSALLVDLDNDGDQDLVVATLISILIYSNDSTGRFTLETNIANEHRDIKSISAADYDVDGNLDLYACVEFRTDATSDAAAEPFLYHDANDAAPNLLLRNEIGEKEGAWRFRDVTVETGLDENNRRHSLAAAWEDYDNDGDLDLYVANDYGQNCLYRNDGPDDASRPQFVDVATDAGVVDFGSGMSVSWGDFDRDGLSDLYVANMYSSAGNRITRQKEFKPDADQQLRALYTRFAKGNTLYRNLGDGTFEDVGAAAAVEMGRWAWSSLFVDLNNDGWEDLFVANGYMTGDDTHDL